MVFGLPLSTLGTPLQGVSALSLLAILGLMVRSWIAGIPDRRRADNETVALTAKIEEDLRGEAAERFREFRLEVHALRNELATVRAELQQTATKSMRRGDKLNMMLFILRMVMDELYAQDPKNKVLAQAKTLLNRVEDEPHQPDNSDVLEAAEQTRDKAEEAVRVVKAEEAKP